MAHDALWTFGTFNITYRTVRVFVLGSESATLYILTQSWLKSGAASLDGELPAAERREQPNDECVRWSCFQSRRHVCIRVFQHYKMFNGKNNQNNKWHLFQSVG